MDAKAKSEAMDLKEKELSELLEKIRRVADDPEKGQPLAGGPNTKNLFQVESICYHVREEIFLLAHSDPVSRKDVSLIQPRDDSLTLGEAIDEVTGNEEFAATKKMCEPIVMAADRMNLDEEAYRAKWSASMDAKHPNPMDDSVGQPVEIDCWGEAICYLWGMLDQQSYMCEGPVNSGDLFPVGEDVIPGMGMGKKLIKVDAPLCC